MKWGFPDGPVVKNQLVIAGDMSSIPGQGTKILHIAWHGQKLNKTKQKQHYIF